MGGAEGRRAVGLLADLGCASSASRATVVVLLADDTAETGGDICACDALGGDCGITLILGGIGLRTLLAGSRTDVEGVKPGGRQPTGGMDGASNKDGGAGASQAQNTSLMDSELKQG